MSEFSSGASVRYVPNESMDQMRANWGANKNPSGVLDPTHVYVIERVEVHSWHTKLWLEGAGGPFNSSHFVTAKEKAAP